MLNLINAYRTYGHLLTQINPLAAREPQLIDLSIERYGLSTADLDIVFDSAKEIGLSPTSLRQIVSTLQQLFCRSVGGRISVYSRGKCTPMDRPTSSEK